MKIKNIRAYRTFFKTEIRKAPDRDEHALGPAYWAPNGEKVFGWFELYHGDKEGSGSPRAGIENFLQSFLDMAKDGQAVYEFLQNASDAGASHFTMAWGRDNVDGNYYALVANNGQVFDLDSVRSILNVGSSTKATDGYSIGKFGIGFKLAHRLVGKDNGLEELLSEEPSGPILFSWSNNEIDQISCVGDFDPQSISYRQDRDKFYIEDTNPWLFKILATCFPALPENKTISEEVKLINGELSGKPVFGKSEVEALKRWVSSHSNIFKGNSYKEGSLFFLKLGKGKQSDLADKNLAEGIRFSMAILQETAQGKKLVTTYPPFVIWEKSL